MRPMCCNLQHSMRPPVPRLDETFRSLKSGNPHTLWAPPGSLPPSPAAGAQFFITPLPADDPKQLFSGANGGQRPGYGFRGPMGANERATDFGGQRGPTTGANERATDLGANGGQQGGPTTGANGLRTTDSGSGQPPTGPRKDI